MVIRKLNRYSRCIGRYDACYRRNEIGTHYTEVLTSLSGQFVATHIASYSYRFSSRYNASFLHRDSVTFAHWNAKPVKHRIDICEIQVRKAQYNSRSSSRMSLVRLPEI